ncbi:LysR family transcriptional regulator [Halovulum dunhuangense]|uniref:LysR family transcriptional regulator n=1 Tax=Halovulum dunhuangense TaxID=1505036 RepID=A0A849L773_9RHOB|nr:LysR family transcriptional regulator [Halovulum dunhuangense]NNU81982.1 LysR family transcriptional regulator [Halovulum dunhuangense]
MDSRLLDDVLALLEEGNLSRAASRRNITQPAFSRRIQSFEDWVGIPLLERRKNRIALHPALAANELEIRATIQRIEALRARLRDGTTGAGRLVLATQHALAASVMRDTLVALHRSEPGLITRLRTMNREDCVSFFLRGEADLLMIYEARGFPPLPFDDTIGRRTWMRDTLVPVCGGALRHRLTEDGIPKAPFPLIQYPPDSHFGRLIHRNGRDAVLFDHGGRVAIETAFSVAALSLAEAGLGVAWLPHSLCLRQIAAGDLVNLAPSFGQIALDVSVFFSKQSADAQRFLSGI